MIHKGFIESLRVFKNQVTEVSNGNECGISIKDYNFLKTQR